MIKKVPCFRRMGWKEIEIESRSPENLNYNNDYEGSRKIISLLLAGSEEKASASFPEPGCLNLFNLPKGRGWGKKKPFTFFFLDNSQRRSSILSNSFCFLAFLTAFQSCLH